MEMKYYNPSNNFKAPIPRIKREPRPYIPPPEIEETAVFESNQPFPVEKESEPVKEHALSFKRKKTGFLGDLSQDDMIILGIIFLLLLNSCDDYLLLLALGYLFISGRELK